MIVTAANMDIFFDSANTRFNEAFSNAQTSYAAISMVVSSSGEVEHYGWMGQIPQLREWIGPRHVLSLVAHGHTIKNRDFELTIGVPRNSIEDDSYGVFSPLFSELGRASAEHPDKLIFELIGKGFTELCYDGQPFFDTDHPVGRDDGSTVSMSNFQDGAGPAWYLLDTSRAVRPFIYQERIPNRLTRLDQDNNENVFRNNQFLYGVRGRSNAGFGLWQLAYASKDTLSAANYATARNAMMTRPGDEGRKLGIRPTTLLVPPSLEGAALKLLNSEHASGGETNEWKGTANLIVTPWLA